MVILIYDEEFIENSKDNYTLDFFIFENGDVLEDVNVEYMTFGTPKYNDDGDICNAIIYCHGSLGNYGSMNKIFPLSYSGGVFDKDKYFFISISALGSPGSCSPSSTKLNNNFPKYSISDMVNFQKKFLKDKFNIEHVLGIIGCSMGGFIALTSAILYPGFADFIMPGVSSYKVAGHDYILSKYVNEVIESDPDYENGVLTDSLIRTLKLASLSDFNYGLSKETLRGMSKSQLDEEFEEFGRENIECLDIFDLKYCNDASMMYDVEDLLDMIICDVLIISCKQDPHFPPELDGIPMSIMIKNSKLIIMNSDLGHLCFNELITIEDDLKEFMGNFGDCGGSKY